MSALRRNFKAVLAGLAIVVIGLAAWRFKGQKAQLKTIVSVADVQAVHADVSAGGVAIFGLARAQADDVIETGADGRARVRLDDGANIVMDRATKLVVKFGALEVQSGRVFVQSGSGAHTAISAAGASAILADGTVAVEVTNDGASFYCAQGEVSIEKAGQKRVRSGETAHVTKDAVTIAPEKAFRDFTHGMATPWSGAGKPRSSVGELWGRLSNVADDGGSPLAIRAHRVDVHIEGEMARTEVQTTYFHGGERAVEGDFRMALPPNALVSSFSIEREDRKQTAKIGVAKDDANSMPRLEWAGEGWVRGNTGAIAPGGSLTTIVEYIEWLSPSGNRLSYRYPMVGEGTPISISELSVHIDANRLEPIAIHAPEGARVSGAVVDIVRADVKPTADITVDYELSPGTVPVARAYVAKAIGEGDAGQYVMVRTEVPAAPANGGVTLALVVDTSLSIDPALLDAERSLVEAVLEGLGPKDRAVVLAADQTTRAVGPADLGSVTPERRAAIEAALTALRPGGATDLGAALEKASDVIPADTPSAMVVYVGDGWPDLGDATVDAVRARLGRRAGGAPRLGAVAVGPLANRFALTALVRGTGPVLEIASRDRAAEVAVDLLADALKPSIAGAELDLGPNVERLYPRGPRTILAGDTITTIGRARSLLPAVVTLRYRSGAEMVEESRSLTRPLGFDEADVRRRWGAARVEELALRGEGRESAVDVATRVSLLTPWTALTFADLYKPSPLDTRVLDLSSVASAPLSAKIATPISAIGTLMGPPLEDDGDKDNDDELRRSVEAAARRTMEEALASIRACRDTRAALRPELSGDLHVKLTLSGDGKVTKVEVRGSSREDDDSALDRCVQSVVSSLAFEGGGIKADIQIEHDVHLPPPTDPRAKRCSPASKLPLPLRRGVWQERLATLEAGAMYLRARAACELTSWSDRRALLELMLGKVTGGLDRVAIARQLENSGETDAAALMRKEAIRRATTPQELWAVRTSLLGDEHKPAGAFRKRFSTANSDDERLEVVRKFLRLAPHDGGLRRRQLALLSALDRKDELRAEILRGRQDPFADAALLADGASLLRKLGDEAEARRAFGELVERAPTDPFARAYLGDRLRGEGLFDDAAVMYEALATLLPDDAAVTLRLALAHAGAGRLDLATRLLSRVAETGGRKSESSLGDLSALVSAALIEDARATSTPDVIARLSRRELELPLPETASEVLVHTPILDSPVRATLRREGDAKDAFYPPDVATPSLGLIALHVTRGDAKAHVMLTRPASLGPSAPVRVHIDVMARDKDGTPIRTLSRDVDVPATGKDVDVLLSPET